MVYSLPIRSLSHLTPFLEFRTTVGVHREDGDLPTKTWYDIIAIWDCQRSKWIQVLHPCWQFHKFWTAMGFDGFQCGKESQSLRQRDCSAQLMVVKLLSAERCCRPLRREARYEQYIIDGRSRAVAKLSCDNSQQRVIGASSFLLGFPLARRLN